jgi:hypothetical protein
MFFVVKFIKIMAGPQIIWSRNFLQFTAKNSVKWHKNALKLSQAVFFYSLPQKILLNDIKCVKTIKIIGNLT